MNGLCKSRATVLGKQTGHWFLSQPTESHRPKYCCCVHPLPDKKRHLPDNVFFSSTILRRIHQTLTNELGRSPFLVQLPFHFKPFSTQSCACVPVNSAHGSCHCSFSGFISAVIDFLQRGVCSAAPSIAGRRADTRRPAMQLCGPLHSHIAPTPRRSTWHARGRSAPLLHTGPDERTNCSVRTCKYVATSSSPPIHTLEQKSFAMATGHMRRSADALNKEIRFVFTRFGQLIEIVPHSALAHLAVMQIRPSYKPGIWKCLYVVVSIC